MGNIVLVTGGFDPLHDGHIAYLNAARRLGDKLVVGLNSDDWLIRKKGYRLIPEKIRESIIGNLKSVDYTILFDDTDGSAKDAIIKTLRHYPFENVIFANGGDRTKENIPEFELGRHYAERLSFAFGVGGEIKMNASSDIMKEYNATILRQQPCGCAKTKASMVGTSSYPPKDFQVAYIGSPTGPS